eukprot:11450717-Alexandrium_andersonii.AAC.1
MRGPGIHISAKVAAGSARDASSPDTQCFPQQVRPELAGVLQRKGEPKLCVNSCAYARVVSSRGRADQSAG